MGMNPGWFGVRSVVAPPMSDPHRFPLLKERRHAVSHASSILTSGHEFYMRMALDEAENALQKQEVPIGSLLVADTGEVLARSHNLTICSVDPTAHAEINVLRQAAAALGNYRLCGTTLYATIEPCVMCMGALIQARVARIVYGAPDPRWGAVESLYRFAEDPRFNHHPHIVAGILADPCREIIQRFFRERRQRTP